MNACELRLISLIRMRPVRYIRYIGALQLVLATLFGNARTAALADLMAEGRILAFGLLFLLTPTPIAAVGLLLLSYAFPLLRSIEAAPRHEAASAVAGGAASADAAAPAQLRYWWTYALLCGARNVLEPALRWVPFMTHWQLLAVLWLQVCAMCTPHMHALHPAPCTLHPHVCQRARTSLSGTSSPSFVIAVRNSFLVTSPSPSTSHW